MAYDLEIGTGDGFVEALIAEWELRGDAADDLSAIVLTVFASDGVARIEDFTARADPAVIPSDVEVVLISGGGTFSSSGQDLVIRVEGTDPVEITAPSGDGTQVMILGGEGDDILRASVVTTTTEGADLSTSTDSLSTEEDTRTDPSGGMSSGPDDPDVLDDRDYVAGLLDRVGGEADTGRALDYWSAVLEDGRMTRAELGDLLGLSAKIAPDGGTGVDDFDFF